MCRSNSQYGASGCVPQQCGPQQHGLIDTTVSDFLEKSELQENKHLISITNIAERKKIRESITKAKVEWEMTFNSTMELIVLVDKELNIIRCNKSFAEFAGVLPIEELIGHKCYEYMTPSDPEQFEHCRELMDREEPVPRTEVKTKTENWFYVSSRPILDEKGKFLHTVIIATDITELKKAQQRLEGSEKKLKKRIGELEKFYEMAVDRELRMKKLKKKIKELESERKGIEEQLLHSQKMEALGQLAGGVAHDFNNILTVITNYGSILRSKVESDTTLKSYVDAILTSSERAANLTRDLLAFSIKQVINPVLSELNLIVKKYEDLISRTICEDIEFRIELTDEDLPVMADSARIELVLMNLVTNACSAMSKGGKLIIRTGRVEFDNDYKKTHGFGKPGMYALISVIDTGAGMDDKTKKRVFEPFFTTKDVGKGTGLGLAITYGIVKQHKGYIHVYSEVGQGTAFMIYLPLVRKEVKEEETVDKPTAVSGTETILLAEDEPSVRTSLRIVMEELGFTVIEAVNGDDAVEKFMENRDKIDFIVFDAVMPGKSGKDAYDAIKMVRPDIKAIFTSGHISSSISVKEIFEEGLTFISKPVQPNDLIKKIREMLDN